MFPVEVCPDCSARLPAFSPAGLCPRCLLRLGVALAEMAMSGSLGAKVDLALAPGAGHRSLETAFSESHGRFVVSGGDGAAISSSLRGAGVPHAVVGKVGGQSLSLSAGRSLIASVPVSLMRTTWEGAIPELMD